MVNWSSIQELEREGDAATKLIHIFAGLFFWEFMFSLDLEWSLIQGRKKFGWPLIPYFLSRYLALGSIIGIVIACDAIYALLTRPIHIFSAKIDCHSLLLFVYVAGLHMLCFASANLAIRTMVVWGMKLYCVIPLCLLLVGYWVLSIQNIFVFGAIWIPGGGCTPIRANNRVLMATFIYPVVMDFVVLMLAAYKLVIQSRSYHRSRLMKLLFQDGFIYFIIVFVVNVPTAVIAYLQLNPILYVLFGLPAATLTVIASCRAVRRLSNFSSKKPAIHTTTSTCGTGGIRNFPPISFKFTRPGNSDQTSLLPVVATVPGSSTSKNSGTCVEKSDIDEVKDQSSYACM